MDCLNGCLRSKHSLRAVRITAQNDFVPNLARNAKETLGRVNSVIPNAQEIELERDLQTLCSFAQARHVCVVNDGLARKMDQIRMRQISKSPGSECIRHLLHVTAQMRFLSRGPEAIDSVLLVVRKVLPEQKIIRIVGTNQAKHVLKIFWIIFGLESDYNCNLVFVFGAQCV